MIWVNVLGLISIGLIVWWFWLYQAKATNVSTGTLHIHVRDGVYLPSKLSIPANQPVELVFVREDLSPCSETLLIPDLEISATLRPQQPVTIHLPATPVGTYPFHCQMQMYTGTLIVEDVARNNVVKKGEQF